MMTFYPGQPDYILKLNALADLATAAAVPSDWTALDGPTAILHKPAIPTSAADLGLPLVENKSSAMIRAELTSANVVAALTYAPYSAGNPANYINAGQAPVQSVGGFVGAVTKTQLGINLIDNVRDIDKVVSTATASAIAVAVAQGKADLVGLAPAVLDTFQEFSAALGADPNFSATMASALGNRLRFDVATQTLTTVQKANAVTNLGLAAVAVSGSKADIGLPLVDNVADADKPVSGPQLTALNLKQNASAKDASGGFAGLTLFAINFWNALGTIKSTFTNANTAARTYLFPDKDITVAGIADITWQQLPDKPTTLAGYGVTSVAWSNVSGAPTTIAGYGITDITVAAFNTNTTNIAANTQNIAAQALAITANTNAIAALPALTWANLGGKPTTIAGFGITDHSWANLTNKPTTAAAAGLILTTADLTDYVDPVGMALALS